MKFDSYSLVARAFPAVISLTPFFILYFFLLQPIIGDFLRELLAIKIASDIIFPLALFFLMIQLNRIVAKEIFEKRIFKNDLNFPTTYFLLHRNSYFTSEYTIKIHARIESDFGIKIPKMKEEIKDEESSKKYITEAVSQIRFKVGKGTLLGQHNTEYGFIRNLSGGNFIAIIMSLLNIIIFTWIYFDNTALIISCITTIIFLILILFSKKMIVSVGQNYAKVLFQEYMSMK